MLSDPTRSNLPLLFSASDLASPRYGEVGYVGTTLVSKFMIACAYNQGVATGVPVMSAHRKDLPIGTVLACVREDIRQLVKEPREVDGVPVDPPLHQPLVLVGDLGNEAGYQLLDGFVRLKALAEAGAAQVRCIIVPPSEALRIGRKLFDQFERSTTTQRTFGHTLPSYEAAVARYAGFDPSEEQVGVEKPVDQKKPNSRPSISHAVRTAFGPNGNPAAAHLLPLVVNSATVESGRVVVCVDTIEGDRALRASFGEGDQKDLDISIRIDPVGREKGGEAARSLYELILTLFLKSLFRRVRKMSDHKANKSGHTIVAERPDYCDWKGTPPDLANWMKTRKLLVTGSGEFFSAPNDDRMFRMAAGWRLETDCVSEKNLDTHLFDLIQVAFRALWLAERQTSNLRDLRKINETRDLPKAHRRRVLDTAADGLDSANMAAAYEISEKDLLQLALLGRLNPAKIRRDTAHHTLAYQWLVAIGDLVRTGRMIVTSLMAQELFIVDDIRATPSQAAFHAAWPLFDRALALAVADHPARALAYRDLVLLCRDAMRGSYAQIVSLSKRPDRCFESNPLLRDDDRSASIAAEIPILLF